MGKNEITGLKEGAIGDGDRPAAGAEQPLTQASLDAAVDRLNNTIIKIGKPLWAVVSLVIIILLIGFVTVLISSYALVLESNNSKTAVYEQLGSKIDQLLAKKILP